jgi:hypothetical protein
MSLNYKEINKCSLIFQDLRINKIKIRNKNKNINNPKLKEYVFIIHPTSVTQMIIQMII